jgi:hypothetical protein
MAEPHVISGLKAKEEEIKKRISGLRKEIKAYQDDLDAIRKALRIFGETWRAGGSRLFRRGEMNKIVLDALRTNPEGLALQLHFLYESESMSRHDWEVMDGERID